MSCGFSLLADNRVQDATITSTVAPVSADLGLENLKNANRSEVCRFSGSTNIDIDIAVACLSDIIIAGSTIRSGTITAEIYDGAQLVETHDVPIKFPIPFCEFKIGTDAPCDTVSVENNNLFLHLENKPTFSKVRLKINTTEPFDLRHILIGNRVYFDGNDTLGNTFKVQHSGGTVYSASGGILKSKRSLKAREYSVSKTNMSQGDVMTLIKLLAEFGERPWFLWGKSVENLLSDQHNFLCKPDEMTFTNNQYSVYETPFKFMEV